MRLLPLLSALCFVASLAAAQRAPIRVPDNQARGTTGMGTNLSSQDQSAVYAEADAAALNTTSAKTINSIPHWSGKFSYAGKVYPYTMVGTNPVSNPVSTTIPTVLIPLRFVFDDYLVNGKPVVLDPASKITLLKNSPIWAQHDWGFGPAQYMDALQRDAFAKTDAYHVILGQPRILPTQVVHVKSSNSIVYQTSTGYVGIIELNFLFNLINTLPHKLGVLPSKIALMYSLDVYGHPFSGSSSYYYGYHGNSQVSSTTTSTTVQVWAWSSWIDPGYFGGANTRDILGITHEIAEIAHDPFLSNNAPGYQYPYSSTSCNTILEVGDVTEGIQGQDGHATLVNGYTYHPANVAMLPWFARSAARTITQSYSFPSTTLLTSSSKPCQ